MRNTLPDISKYKLKMPVEQTLETETTTTTFNAVPILVGIMIVLVTALIGLYLWSTDFFAIAPEETIQATRPTAEENNEPESTTAEARVDTLTAQSQSRNVGVIESELVGTFIEPIDGDIRAIESELGL